MAEVDRIRLLLRLLAIAALAENMKNREGTKCGLPWYFESDAAQQIGVAAATFGRNGQTRLRARKGGSCSSL
jgi:hypothetical protein